MKISGWLLLLLLAWTGVQAQPFGAWEAVEGRFLEALHEGDFAKARHEFTWMYQLDSVASSRYAEEVEEIYLQPMWRGEAPPLSWSQVDTLLHVYDMAHRYDREQSDRWLIGKARLLLMYPARDRREHLHCLTACVELGAACPPEFYPELHERIINEYKLGIFPLPLFMLKHQWLKEAVWKRSLTRTPQEEMDWDQLLQRMEMRARLEIPDCQALEKEWRAPLMAAELTAEQQEGLFLALVMQGCESPAMYYQAETALPVEAAAFRVMAQRAMQENRPEDALDYYAKAARHELNGRYQASDRLQAARILLLEGRLEEAKAMAHAASEGAPEWGEPYLLIAEVIAAEARQCDEGGFDRKAMFWVAIDYLQLARNADPHTEETASKLLYEFRHKAPQRDECRARNLLPGDSWPIRCLPGTVTTVRY